jgi:hypothetical protein
MSQINKITMNSVRNIVCLARRNIFMSSRLLNISKTESIQENSDVSLVDTELDPEESAAREERIALLRNKSRLLGEN